MRSIYIYLFVIIVCCVAACRENIKCKTDTLCGGSFRYWYSSRDPGLYHYFDINGRKEIFYVNRFGVFREFKMSDVIISTIWKPLNDSTILLSGRELPIKFIDDETIIFRDDTLCLLKDYKYIPKEYQKILGEDIKTGGLGR